MYYTPSINLSIINNVVPQYKAWSMARKSRYVSNTNPKGVFPTCNLLQQVKNRLPPR